MDRVIIFGASILGKIAYNVLKNKYNICYFSDNDEKKWGTKFCEIEIVPPQNLVNYKECKIIIASMYYTQISIQLSQLEIDNIFLFSYADITDKEYDKRYSIDKICDSDVYSNLNIDETFKKKFVKNFSLNYRCFDKSKVNSKNDANYNKNILIIGYIFPPIGGGGVQRTLKFTKYLKELGYNPTVITVGNDFAYDKKDYSLLKELPDDIKIIRIDHNMFNSEQLNHKKVQQIINLLYGIIDDRDCINTYINELQRENFKYRDKIMLPDIYIPWVDSVLEEIEQKLNISNFKYIYTTSSPYSAHLIGYYIKRKYGTTWFMDFRDEWTNHPYFASDYKRNEIKYIMEKELERKMIEFANKVIVVTPSMKKNYINNFMVRDSKVELITNGYDEWDFNDLQDRKKNEKFTMTFSGSMYKEINPKTLIISINELIDLGLVEKNKIVLKFMGTIQNDILDEIHILDKYKITEFIGYLPHKESLEVCNSSEVLLIILGKAEILKSVYGGKVFEYLRLKRPILALSPKGSILEQLLIKTNAGKNFEYNDFDKIKSYVYQLYNCWEQGIEKFEPIESEIIKFNRKNLTGNFIKILESFN